MNEGRPVHCNCAFNMDFSTFPLLVERTWQDLTHADHRLSRRLPKCAFQHYCTTLLSATIIDYKQNILKDSNVSDEKDARSYMDYPIPVQIAEYFSLITGTMDQTGVKYELNVLQIAIPLSGKDGGSFGDVTASNHNVYECYAAPLVTRRKIEATLAKDKNWRPLPDHLMSKNLVPTQNFIGYEDIGILHPESEEFMFNLHFPGQNNSSSIQQRIQFSGSLMANVALRLQEYSSKYYINPTAIVEKKKVPGLIGFLEVAEAVGNTEMLADVNAMIYSCNSLPPLLSAMTYICGLRRRRLLDSPGLCCLTDSGTPPIDWVSSRNANFEAEGPFSLVRFQDDPGLRVKRFVATPSCSSRCRDIDDWIALNRRR